MSSARIFSVLSLDMKLKKKIKKSITFEPDVIFPWKSIHVLEAMRAGTSRE